MATPMKYTTEGIPKNWDGKDWQTYKWAMRMVFKEQDLLKFVERTLTKSMLTSEEKESDFDTKQTKIMRMIGTSVPPEILHQIREAETGSDMWDALCDLFENKVNKTAKVHTIRRLVSELWDMKLTPGEDANLHLCKIFNLRTELINLQYTLEDSDMVEMLLESLPEQAEFETLKASVRYGADSSGYTPTKVRELIRAAASRQREFRGKHGGQGGNPKNVGPKGGGKGRSDTQKQYKPRAPKGTRKCFSCGSLDHLVADCPKVNKQSGDGAGSNNQKRKLRGNCTIRRPGSAASKLQHGETSEPGLVAGALGEQTDAVGASVANGTRDNTCSGETQENVASGGEHAAAETCKGGWWYFDTASNAHVTGNRAHYVVFTEDTTSSQSIHGVSPELTSQVAGVGTVALETNVNGEQKVVFIDDVCYVPGADRALFSPGRALEQGLDFDIDAVTKSFEVKKDGQAVAIAIPQDATWGFIAVCPVKNDDLRIEKQIACNCTVAEGVASLTTWHERLGHTCPQYLKTMVDKGLVRGMMLSKRQQGVCDACHIGKQKKRAHRKKLNRGTRAPNQVVYADILIPSRGNGTRYEAVLVLMDGFSRFVKVHLLNSKASEVINKHIMEYVLWAERQAGRHEHGDGSRGIKYPVKQVLTDKGGEFINSEMPNWISPVTLAGSPAQYVKNRVYNKSTKTTPYEKMFGIKPDIHHIRTFGALAYAHVPVTPGRRKHHDNAKLGYVLGYADDVVGCKVYFPEEHTAKFVADLRVAEDVLYRDRHENCARDDDLESLHFRRASAEVEGDNSDQSEVSSTQRDLDEPMDTASVLEEGDDAEDSIEDGEDEICSEEGDAGHEFEEGDAEHDLEEDAVNVVQDRRDEELPAHNRPPQAAVNSDGMPSATEIDKVLHSKTSNNFAGVATESVVSVCGSVGDELEPQGADDDSFDVNMESSGEEEVRVETTEDDEEVTVASVFASANNDEQQLQVDNLEVDADDNVGDVPPVRRPTGKRSHRDETPSEEERVERSAEKQTPKRTRTGLREVRERRRPNYLNDYVVNALQKTSRVLDEHGQPIRACEVKIPRGRREVKRSKFANFLLTAEMEEIAALKAKGVLEEIPSDEMPENAKPVNTMWVYAVKADHQGYVIRFKARLVALGNCQRPGIDFHETFAPVARMSSFRLLLALAATMHLSVYGGDINTAYLNARLEIPQYVKSIQGFPCEVEGHVYIVKRALYGLRQSGREWNSEINQWMLQRGYQRSLTEPCLYYKFEGDTIAYVLIYVDDILVATNDEQFKMKLFADLDDAYGIKDQGLLSQYLGIEVVQTKEQITIRQSQYAREILQHFGYEDAHAVGNPMETNVRLVAMSENDESDTHFPYREVIGMLMYLATSTRPDLAFAIGQLSRFVSNPSTKHVGTVKRVLRYLAGTIEYGITYRRADSTSDSVALEGYCDSDWANDPESRKSTSGFVFVLAGGAVSWMSRRQPIVALSTAEAEYVAACEAAMEATAESNILQEILPHRAVKLSLGIDNQAAYVMATNPTYSRRTRHIELRWHYVREQVEKGVLQLHKVQGDVNPADTFTKPLDKHRLKTLLHQIGIGTAE